MSENYYVIQRLADGKFAYYLPGTSKSVTWTDLGGAMTYPQCGNAEFHLKTFILPQASAAVMKSADQYAVRRAVLTLTDSDASV